MTFLLCWSPKHYSFPHPATRMFWTIPRIHCQNVSGWEELCLFYQVAHFSTTLLNKKKYSPNTPNSASWLGAGKSSCTELTAGWKDLDHSQGTRDLVNMRRAEKNWFTFSFKTWSLQSVYEHVCLININQLNNRKTLPAPEGKIFWPF